MQLHRHRFKSGSAVALMAALALPPACKKQEPVVIDARPRLADPAPDLLSSPSSVQPSPSPSLPVVSPPPNSGEEPTVELSGVVRLGPSGRPRYPVSVIIASGDCASPDSRLLRRLPLSDTDSFYAVVMADPGEKLSVCVASEPAPGLATPIWARSESLTVGNAHEQSFANLSLVLRSAEPKSFAVKPRTK